MSGNGAFGNTSLHLIFFSSIDVVSFHQNLAKVSEREKGRGMWAVEEWLFSIFGTAKEHRKKSCRQKIWVTSRLKNNSPAYIPIKYCHPAIMNLNKGSCEPGEFPYTMSIFDCKTELHK